MVQVRGSAGIFGANLQFGTANPPPNEPLGPTSIAQMPVAQLPVRHLGGSGIPGARHGVPGMPAARASGNPDVATIPEVAPPKRPLGAPRPPGVMNPPHTQWRGGADFANDKLITRDRHGMFKTGTELSGRNSGLTDPPRDGPARPSLKLIQRTINWQQGSDTTRAQDDLTRPYLKVPTGEWAGTRGDPWNQVYGGTPGLWQPYGSYQGYTAGPVKGIQAPVEEGAPGDGSQSFAPGPPNGLHSPTMPNYSQTLGYYMAVPQMRLPRMDRPDNSRAAGQSYSQTVVPQGQTGTVALNNMYNPTVAWRQGGGWRGMQNG
jgi:hypothetical protein